MIPQEKTYRVAEAAERLNVKPITVYRWIQNGTLKALRVGPKMLRVPESEINRLLSVPEPEPEKV